MKRYAARFWAFLSAISLLLSLAACGGKNTKATSMHLKRTEGTVAVSDGDGKDVPLLNNLGLYSGYGVDTQSASYAWIDLDDVKLAKMDEKSEIAIRKDGKKLDIEVKSGSLFFNVTEPLADDETMNISTSTMLIGIRGTCGWVEDNDGLSRTYLLEGKVECSTGDQTVQVNAGEMAELTADGELVVEPFATEDLPAFVRDELNNGPDDSPGPDVSETVGGQEYQPDNADDLLAALTNARNGDVITLPGDIDLDAVVTVSGGSEDNPVVLDLNGHMLTVTYDGFGVIVSGALRICDRSTGGGTLTLAGSEHSSIQVVNSAYLFLDDGTVSNEKEYDAIISVGTFTMNGGTVNGNVVTGGSSTATMNGGTINFFVITFESAIFTMNGGTTYGAGSNNNSTFTMNGGTIDGASSSDNSTFIINDGVINRVETFDNSTFTMNGGTINGYVNIFNNSTFTRNGGRVNGAVH